MRGKWERNEVDDALVRTRCGTKDRRGLRKLLKREIGLPTFQRVVIFLPNNMPNVYIYFFCLTAKNARDWATLSSATSIFFFLLVREEKAMLFQLLSGSRCSCSEWALTLFIRAMNFYNFRVVSFCIFSVYF